MADVNSPETPQSGPNIPRWLKVVLAGSLALNLAVIGGVVGLALTFDGPPPDKDFRSGAAGAYIGAFDKSTRRELRERMRESFKGERPSREQFAANTRAFAALVRAEPLDVAALQAHLDAQTDRFEQGRKFGEQMLIQTLQTLDPAARAAYAARLEQFADHGPKGGKDFKPH
mgnify:CR=1 FL=1